MGEVVFLGTSNASRGGLLVSIDVYSKERFFEKVDAWHEAIGEGRYYGYPTYRYAFIDGAGSGKLKNMPLSHFEKIFDDEDIKRLGKLLEYGKDSYNRFPVFLKEVYLKHGYQHVKEDG